MTAIAPARPRPTSTRHAAPAHYPGPVRRPARRPGRHLRPVERPRPKRSPAVPALVGVGMVIAALLALAVMHALLIGGQVRLDAMRRDVAAESEAIRRLELRVAELESPDRVLDVARDRLGMVQPAEVGYLLPVGVEGGAEEPVRVAPAEIPPEPEADVVAGEQSPEQAEVEQAVAADGSTTDPTAGTDSAAEDDAGAGDVDDAAGRDPDTAPDQPVAGGRDE